MSRNNSKRWPIPCFAGMPARILSSRIRRHSARANLPNKKNASRGSVAIQFGLPRPAFSICAVACCAVSLARWIRLSFSSKGDSLESALCSSRVVLSSIVGSPHWRLRQQYDDDHPPDREQCVAHGVGDGVAERRHLALRLIAHQAERCRRRARSGNDAEGQRVVKTK